MMSAYLSEILCSNCQAAGLDLQAETTAVCRYCGTVNTVTGLLCPHCEFINTADAQTCAGCHQSLYRKCPRCGTPNWAGAEQCLRCQNPLDTVGALGARYFTDTAGRLRAQQHDAASIKAKEAADSDRRLAELNAIEQRRQQALDRAVRARDSEQRMWITLLIVIGFIVVIGGVVFLVSMSTH